MFLNSADLFLSHRQHLAKGVMAAGYRLTVLVPPGPNVQTTRDLGYPCETVTLGRKSIFPFYELFALIHLYFRLRLLKPDILHSFTIKPVLYGSLVARFLGIPKVVNTVTGLGFAFIDTGVKAAFVRGILSAVYRFAFSRFDFIFQNSEDMKLYIANGWIGECQAKLIPGTGVDFDFFSPLHLSVQREIPVVLFAGRYLRDKGLGELVQACSELWNEGHRLRLVLCGKADGGNPNSFSIEDIKAWQSLPFIEDLGFQKDMRSVYRRSDIMCLPSYREGLPLALIEASACECALIATDVPGCRDIVVEGQNGLLVAPRSVIELKRAIASLCMNQMLSAKLGKRARVLAQQKYEKIDLVAQGMRVYDGAA